ncbi:hypothetical protein ACSV9I_21000 [Rhizobium sp. G187]|uniref:hypothetical protein n=1 Tax=Rhizobium sp. G187 TaxID=3451352 RepID=UPI003EE49E64
MNSYLDFIAAAMLLGILLNLIFKDKKLMYLSAFSLPFFSAFIVPQVLPTAMAACVALVWGVLCFILGAIRDRL